MRGVHIFEKPCYKEIRVMRGRAMRGLPVLAFLGSISPELTLVASEFGFLFMNAFNMASQTK